jgi:[acyl-carrier-protein] S-malonyltransferase
LCQKAAQGEIVTPANFNAIGQTVIAGQAQAVQRVVELAKPAGAKLAKLLPVSVPSHCALMQPAAEALAERLAKIPIKTPIIKVIHNESVCDYADPEMIRKALVKQLISPVRWVESMQYFAKQGIKLAIECGAGKVLTGLNKRITTEFETLPFNTPAQLQTIVETGLKPVSTD